MQKTAEAAANNATIAQDLKRTLLMRLKRIEAKYPMDATEVRVRDGGRTAIYRIRDLTASFADLTKDMVFEQERSNGLLQSLMELERRGESDG